MPPKDPISSSRENDNWAPGQLADGSILAMTPDEAAAALGQREADEEAFGAMLDGEDIDDISDLDDDDE